MPLTILPLTDLRESFENDKNILGAILDIFMVEVPEDCLLLQQSINSGDYTTAGMQAHKVKSSYRTLGITKMATILQGIEDRAKNKKDMQDIPNLLHQFNENYEQINAQVLYTKEHL
ncbi:Hpt domain-containing protein [Nonlabens sp. Ci31]|jgi:HPt (histidine-containing phosphotransfer) domain-containing protein|uniref:Hpt domain-containing protein n=1 Tax=Nonlabens sp. Ci31 TaxID=2608253 RepID=UPI0014644B33|nr:Hpt domain-containing protein [Nonlabens sp. Ci31]QJP35657.1 Hpt domain-containing protein [Nonlabens sp. Ci31]